MQVYERETAPLIEFYENEGLLLSLAAKGSPEQIYNRTKEALMASFTQ